MDSVLSIGLFNLLFGLASVISLIIAIAFLKEHRTIIAITSIITLAFFAIIYINFETSYAQQLLSDGYKSPEITSDWGPERNKYSTDIPANYNVFNSISDNPAHGDERNFVQIREEKASETTYVDSIELKEGETYVVYAYYSNDAGNNYNLTAEDSRIQVKLPFYIPPNGSNGIRVFINSSNAKPSKVWDSVLLNNSTGTTMKIDYVKNSTTIHTFGKLNGLNLSDYGLFNNGTLIGYDQLDGKILGNETASGYITFRIVVSYPTETIMTSATTNSYYSAYYRDEIAIKSTDEIEIMGIYTNTSVIDQNVVIKDNLPDNLEYIKGSTEIAKKEFMYDYKHFNDEIINEEGIDIGSYKPGEICYIKFKAKIKANTPSNQDYSFENIMKALINDKVTESVLSFNVKAN